MKRNKKIIVISMIVLSIALLVLFSVLSMLKHKEKVNDSIVIPNGLQNKYPTNTITISQKYKGNLQMKDISTTVSEFMTGTIPFLREHTINMKENEIVEYYNTNRKDIKKRLGNLTDAEFLNLIKIIQQFSNQQLEYETSEYIKDSIKVKNGDLDVKLKIKYKDENEIFIKVHIPTTSYSIKFVAV